MKDILAVRDELNTVRSFIQCASDASNSDNCEGQAVVAVLDAAIARLCQVEIALEAINNASAMQS